MLEVLQLLSTASLRSLAASLRGGALSLGITRHPIAQVAGPHAAAIHACLDELLRQGLAPQHIALLIEAIAETRERAADPTLLFELVLSGPEVPGVPTADTAAALHTLIEEATAEVLLVGYVIHDGQRLFERLAARMRTLPGLRVVFCLDISRKYGDTSLASEIVRRFVHEFRTKHWPWPEPPELFYDPRSLAESTEQRSSLHAKCVVVDRRVALVTSANFTEAAQHRNIEVGVLVRHLPIVERLAGYFEALRASGQLVRCPLD